jgi:DNA-binding SARP family transcriptional activator/DNA-binding XRE family transcriptional regulator
MDGDDHGPAALAALLRGYRHDAGLTQHELARRAGLSVGAVRDLEQSRTRRPLPGSLTALAAALNLNPAQAEELGLAVTVRGLRLQVLGPLTAWRDGAAISLGGPGRRAVLGLMALTPGSLLHRAAIIDVLWPGNPPANAVSLVQAHVSRLRQTLDIGRPTTGEGPALLSAGASYRLRVGTGELDLLSFRQLAAAARMACSRGDHRAACDQYEQALELWQGEPLADVDLLRGHPAVAGLGRQRSETVIEYAQVASAAGQHGQVLALLFELAAREPLNEAAHKQLMLALAGSGRQAEALTVYHDMRRRLDEELAIPPGPDLAEAYLRVLRQDIPAARAAAVAVTSGAAAAPERTTPVPRQLPAARAVFVGRAPELSALNGLLDAAAGTVVITAMSGTAGIGKTALALHWARRVAVEFPDGQLYVNLRGFDQSGTPVLPAEAVRWLLDALGVTPDRIPPSIEARAGLYRSLVADKRLLIVLDNARDVDQVRPLLPGAPACLVLITSRARLAGLAVGEGAHLMTLDVLTQEEARQLLQGLLGPRRAAAEPHAVDELIGLCARLPLALAVAAARAVDRPGFQLAALAAELHDAAGRLDILDAGDPASSVRAVLSWSYQSLRAPAARMFRLLGVHAGPDISAPAAASLVGTGLAQARQDLAELSGAHLLTEHSPGRYAFHDLLRAYAADQAAAIEGEQARRAAIHRVLDHYLYTARAADRLLNPARDPITPTACVAGASPEQLSDYGEAMAWFKVEHQVLLAAVGLAADTSLSPHAWQIPWALVDYLEFSGHWHDWIATQQIGLAATRRLGDSAGEARCCRGLGCAYARMGRDQDAHAHLSQGLGLFRRAGDRVGEARTHQDLSWLFDRQGRPDQALHHDQLALRLYQQEGHRAGQANALNAIGWLHGLLGDHRRALDYCGQALAMHRALGNRRGQAATWDSLGYAHHHLGQLTEAITCYLQSLDMFRQLSDRSNQAEILTHLGDTHHAAGDPHQAQDAWQQALDILDELQHPDADQVRAKLSSLAAAPAARPASGSAERQG